MQMSFRSLPGRLALVLMALGLGMAPAGAALAQGAGRGPVVLAAASLAEAINAVADAWSAQGHPRPVISLAASSVLARQVEAGAPADLFISADEDWMDELAGKGLIRPASRADLLGNRLVLIAPAGSTVRLHIRPGFALAAALDTPRPGGRLATGAPASVPVGRYARQSLEKLGVWPGVSDRIAGADNVRAALALVARGEAPLGIVYATDAMAEPKVRVVDRFPESSHAPIRYPVALLTASASPDAAGFRRFLASGAAKAIFRAKGFTLP